MSGKVDIGLIGLAVMGENLVLNMANKGFSVAVFNRTVEKVDRFVEGRVQEKKLWVAIRLRRSVHNWSGLKVMMVVKAGPAVDALIEQLLPYLKEMLLLMAEIAIIPIRFVERNMLKARGCSIWVLGFRVVKRCFEGAIMRVVLKRLGYF